MAEGASPWQNRNGGNACPTRGTGQPGFCGSRTGSLVFQLPERFRAAGGGDGAGKAMVLHGQILGMDGLVFVRQPTALPVLEISPLIRYFLMLPGFALSLFREPFFFLESLLGSLASLASALR